MLSWARRLPVRALECLRFGTAIELPVSVCVSFKFECGILSTNRSSLNAQIAIFRSKGAFWANFCEIHVAVE